MSKKLYLLLLSSLISATLFFYLFCLNPIQNEQSPLSYLETVKDKIEKKIKEQDVNAQLIKEHWVNKGANKTLTDFLQVTHDFLAYEFNLKGQLNYWNNNQVSINVDSSLLTQNNPIIKLTNGYYFKRIFKNEKSEVPTILVLLYLFKTDYKIENKIFSKELNPTIFPDGNYHVQFDSIATSDKSIPIKDSFKNSLFHLINSSTGNSGTKTVFLILSGFLSILFFLWFIVIICNNLKFRTDRKYFILGAIILAGAIVLVKYFSSAYLSPLLMGEIILFDPTYFAISNFLPSLGDVIISVILSFVLFFYLIPITDHRLPITSSSSPITVYRLPISVYALFIFLTASSLCFYLIWEIYKNKTAGFIISHDSNFTFFHFYSICFIGFLFFLLFLLFQKIIIFAGSLNSQSILKDRHLPLLIIFFLVSIAFITSLIIRKSYYEDTLTRMKILSQNLITGNDVLAEYFLNENKDKIANDPSILSRFIRPSVNEEFIQQKIKHTYLNRYFDKYDVSIEVYKNNGLREGNLSTDNYFELEKEAREHWSKTEYRNLYFRQFVDNGAFKEYLQFIPVTTTVKLPLLSAPSSGGYILIRLGINKIQTTNLLPKLLIDQKYYESINSENYSFAIFSKGKQLFSNSDLNYENIREVQNYFPFNKKDSFFKTNGFIHLIQPYSQNKFNIISSPEFSYLNFFSNFCFCFFIFGLFWIFFWLILSLLKVSGIIGSSFRSFSILNFRTSFASKIQYFIASASVLPLLIVIGVSVVILVLSHEDNQAKKSLEKAHGVKKIISVYFKEYKEQKISKDKFEILLKDYSTIIGYDITIYNERGMLLFTTQPTVYELELKAGLMDPVAFQHLIDIKDRILFQHEKMGNKEYSSIYMKMESPDKGDLPGILNLQYLESEEELIREVRDLISAIVNVYVPVIILFVILSLFFNRSFLLPLEMLSEKLRTLSFEHKETGLEWKSDDEIGILVKQYNSMLIKLDESRLLLARSERESAWKDIAQKVAHEIKNPLTPMKLTLQHLDRALKDKHPKTEEMIKKAIENLIEQIETLNEIASTFSMYAKMPLPVMKELNLVEIISRQVVIFQQSAQATIESNLSENPKILISADDKELSRVFSNLFINAIQAVPKGRKPMIAVTIKTINQMAQIEIRDNGTGIPEDIRNSVFLPRFTTKNTGSGLGLALCKKSVDDIGGRIWFETEINEGTSFFVELPVLT